MRASLVVCSLLVAAAVLISSVSGAALSGGLGYLVKGDANKPNGAFNTPGSDQPATVFTDKLGNTYVYNKNMANKDYAPTDPLRYPVSIWRGGANINTLTVDDNNWPALKTEIDKLIPSGSSYTINGIGLAGDAYDNAFTYIFIGATQFTSGGTATGAIYRCKVTSGSNTNPTFACASQSYTGLSITDPAGVVSDSKGNMYVYSNTGHIALNSATITFGSQKLYFAAYPGSPTSSFTFSASAGNSLFLQLISITVSPISDEVYVVDQGLFNQPSILSTLYRISAPVASAVGSRQVIARFGTPSTGSWPVGLTVDTSGNVLVGHTNGKVYRFPASIPSTMTNGVASSSVYAFLSDYNCIYGIGYDAVNNRLNIGDGGCDKTQNFNFIQAGIYAFEMNTVKIFTGVDGAATTETKINNILAANAVNFVVTSPVAPAQNSDLNIIGVDYKGVCTCYDPEDRVDVNTADPGPNRATQRGEISNLCGSTSNPAVVADTLPYTKYGTSDGANANFVPKTGLNKGSTPALGSTNPIPHGFVWTPSATYVGVYTLCFEYQWGTSNTYTGKVQPTKYIPPRGIQIVVQQPITLIASSASKPNGVNIGFNADAAPKLTNQLLNAIYSVDVHTGVDPASDVYVTNGLPVKCALTLSLSANNANNAVVFTPSTVLLTAQANAKAFTWQSGGVVAANVPWTIGTGTGANCAATINGVTYNLFVLGSTANGKTADTASAGVVSTQVTDVSKRNPDQWAGPGVNPSIMFTPVTTFVSTINPTIKLTIAPPLTGAGEITVVPDSAVTVDAVLIGSYSPAAGQKFTKDVSIISWVYTPTVTLLPKWQFLLTNVGTISSSYTIFANDDAVAGVNGIKFGVQATTNSDVHTVWFQPAVSLSTAISVSPPGDVAGQITLKPGVASGLFKIWLPTTATGTGNDGIVLADGLQAPKKGAFSPVDSKVAFGASNGPSNFQTFTYTPGAYVGPVTFTYTLAGYQYYATTVFTIFVQATPSIAARYSQLDPAYAAYLAFKPATVMVPLNAASVPQLQTATPWMINMGGPTAAQVVVTITSNSATGLIKGSDSATVPTSTNIVKIEAGLQFGFFTYADSAIPGSTPTLTFAMTGADFTNKFFVGTGTTGGNPSITKDFLIHGLLTPTAIAADSNVYANQNYVLTLTANPPIPTSTLVRVTAVDWEDLNIDLERNQGTFTEISTATPVAFANSQSYLSGALATVKLAYNLAASSLVGADKLILGDVPLIKIKIEGPYIFAPPPALSVFVDKTDANSIAATELHTADVANMNQWSWPQFTSALPTGFTSGNTKDDSTYKTGVLKLPAIKGTMTLTIPTLPAATGTGFYLNGVTKAMIGANPGAPATPITVTFAPALTGTESVLVGFEKNAGGKIELSGTNSAVTVVQTTNGDTGAVLPTNAADKHGKITITATANIPVASVTFVYYPSASVATAINFDTLYLGVGNANYVLGSIIATPAPPTFTPYVKAVGQGMVTTNYVVPTITFQGYCTLASNTLNPIVTNFLFGTTSKNIDVVCFPTFNADTIYTTSCSNPTGCTVVPATGTGTTFGAYSTPGNVPTSSTQLTINPGTIPTGTDAKIVLTPTLTSGGGPTPSWATVLVSAIPVVGAITFTGPTITTPQAVGTTITGFTVAVAPAPASAITLTIRDGATAGTFASADATFISGGVGSGYATFKVSSATPITFSYTPTAAKKTAFTASAVGYVLSGTPPSFSISSQVVWANSDKVLVSAGTPVSYTLKIANGATSVNGFTVALVEAVPVNGAVGKFNYQIAGVKQTEQVTATPQFTFSAGSAELQFWYTPNAIGSVSLTPTLSGSDITAGLFPATIALPAKTGALGDGALSLTVSGGVTIENIPTSLAVGQKVTIKVTVSPLPAIALVVALSDGGMGGSFSSPSLSFVAGNNEVSSKTVTYTAPAKIPADTGTVAAPISGQKGITVGLSGGGDVTYLINPQTITTTGLAVTDLITPGSFLIFKLRIAALPSVSGVVFNTVPSLAAAVGVKKTNFNALTSTTSATVLGSLNANNAAVPVQFAQQFVPGQLAPPGLTSYTATVPFDTTAVVVNVAFAFGTMIVTDGSSGQQFALPTALTGFVTPIMYLAPGANTFSVFNGPVPGKGDGLYTFTITRLSLYDVKLVCASNPDNYFNYGGALRVGDTIPVPFFVAGPESAGGIWSVVVPYECVTVGVIAVGVGAPVILTTLYGITPKPSPLSLPLNFPSDKLGVAFGWADSGNSASFTVGGGPDGLTYSFGLTRNTINVVQYNGPTFACASSHVSIYVYPNTPLLTTGNDKTIKAATGFSMAVAVTSAANAAINDDRGGLANTLQSADTLANLKLAAGKGGAGYSVTPIGFITPDTAAGFPIKIVTTIASVAGDDPDTPPGYENSTNNNKVTTYIYYGQC